MRILLYSFAAFVVITLSYACSKASLVGSEIFVPDSINVFFKDDYKVNAKTVSVDSVLTFDVSPELNTVIIGQLDDPIFGETKAEGFLDLILGGNNLLPNFEYTKDGQTLPVTIDSVVMTLIYNEGGFYGDTNAVHNLEVRVVDEAIDGSEPIYSNMRFPSSTVIGSKSFVPSPGDSVFVLNPGDTAATAVVNQMRVRLDNSWAQAMVDNPELVDSASSFLEYAPAVHLISEPTASSTMGFDLTFSSTEPLDNSIYVYYTDTLPKRYRFSVIGVKNNYFEHNTEGAEVASFFDDEAKGDSLLFVQGMSGPEIEVDLAFLASDDLDDFVINRVALEFFVLEDASSDIHAPLENVILQSFNDDGEVNIIEDVFVALESGQADIFDGRLGFDVVNGITLKKYSVILTVHAIREMMEAESETKLRIVPRNKLTAPSRSIIYGPGHSQYPMKLKVNYSE